MKRKKFIIATSILAGGLFLSLVFILSPVNAQQKPAFKLGVNVDTPGQAAWLGEPVLQAFQLYAEQINAKGGIDGQLIELLIYENECNPEKASSIAKKLVQRDKVVAMMSAGITATANAVQPVAQEEKMLMYACSLSFKPSYPGSVCFTTWSDNIDMVETVYEYFVKKGIKRIAALFATDSTGQTWFDEMTKTAKKHGVEITSERFNVNDLDVTSQLTKLKAINPQALFVGVSGKASAVVAKNFNQMGFKIPYATSTGNISETFLALMKGNEPDILVIPSPYCVVWKELPESYPQKKLMKEFHEAFQKRFKKEGDVYGVVGYDAMRIVVEALKQVKPEGPKDSIKLRDAIEKIKNFPAVYGGTYNFSQDDHRGMKGNALMIALKGGKFVMAP